MSYNIFSAKEICEKNLVIDNKSSNYSSFQQFGWYHSQHNQWKELSKEQKEYLISVDLTFSIFRAIQVNQQYNYIQHENVYVVNSKDGTYYQSDQKQELLFNPNGFWNSTTYGGPFGCDQKDQNGQYREYKYKSISDFDGYLKISNRNIPCSKQSGSQQCICQPYNSKRLYPRDYRCYPWYELSVENEYVTISQSFQNNNSSQQILTCSLKIVDEKDTQSLETEKHAQPKSVLGFDMKYEKKNSFDIYFQSNEVYSYLVAPKSQQYMNDIKQWEEYEVIIHPNLTDSKFVASFEQIFGLEFQNGDIDEIEEYKKQLGYILLDENIREYGCNQTQIFSEGTEFNIRRDGQDYYSIVKSLQICYGNLEEQKRITLGHLVTNIASNQQQFIYSDIDKNIKQMQTLIVVGLIFSFVIVIAIFYFLLERFLKYNFEEPVSIISSVMIKADPQMIDRFYKEIQRNNLRISYELKNLVSAINQIISLVQEKFNDPNQNNEKDQQNYFKALQTFEVVDHQSGIGLCLNNLGNVFLLKKDYKTSIEFYKKAYLLSKAQYGEETIQKEKNNLQDNINNTQDDLKRSKPSYSLKDSSENSSQDYNTKKKFMKIHASRMFQLASAILKYVKDGNQFEQVNKEIKEQIEKENLKSNMESNHKQFFQVPQNSLFAINQNVDLIQSRKISLNQRRVLNGINMNSNQLSPPYVIHKESNQNIFGSNVYGKKTNKLASSNKIQNSLSNSKQFVSFGNQKSHPVNNNLNNVNLLNFSFAQDISQSNNIVQNIPSARVLENNQNNNNQFNTPNKTQTNDTNASNIQFADLALNQIANSQNNLNLVDEIHDRSNLANSQRQSNTNLVFQSNINSNNTTHRNNQNNSYRNKKTNNEINNNVNSNNTHTQINLTNYNINKINQNNHNNGLNNGSNNINNLNKKINSNEIPNNKNNTQNNNDNNQSQENQSQKIKSYSSMKQNSFPQKFQSSENSNDKYSQIFLASKQDSQNIHENEEQTYDKFNIYFDEQVYSLEQYPHFFRKKFADSQLPIIRMNKHISKCNYDLHYHSLKNYCKQSLELLNESLSIFNKLGDYCLDNEKKDAHQYYGYSILALLAISELHLFQNKSTTIIQPLLTQIKKYIYTKIIPLEAIEQINFLSQLQNNQHSSPLQQYPHLQQGSQQNNSSMLNNQTQQYNLTQTTIQNYENLITNNNYLQTEQYFDANHIENNTTKQYTNGGQQLPQLDIYRQNSEKMKKTHTNNQGGSYLSKLNNYTQSQFNNSLKQTSILQVNNSNHFNSSNQTQNLNNTSHQNVSLNQTQINNSHNFMSFTNLQNNTLNQNNNDKMKNIFQVDTNDTPFQNNSNNKLMRGNESKENLLNSDVLLTKYYILKGLTRKSEKKNRKALKSFMKGIKYFFPKSSSQQRINSIMKNALVGHYKFEDSPETLSVIQEESSRNSQAYYYDPNDILICLEEIQTIIETAKMPISDYQKDALKQDIMEFKRKQNKTESLHFLEVFFRDSVE